MPEYMYTVTFKNQDGMEIIETGKTIIDISKKCGLSKDKLYCKLSDKRSHENEIVSVTKEVIKAPIARKKWIAKNKPTYKVDTEEGEKTFVKLKDGAKILNMTIATLHRTLKNPEKMEELKISIV